MTSAIPGDTAVRNDLAVLVLSREIAEIDPPTLPVATNGAQVWANGIIVGFGLTANPKIPKASLLAQLILPGLKAQGSVSPTPCSTEAYLDPSASLCSLYSTNSGGSQATVCGGDSGRPLWYAVTNQTSEIGVTSGRNKPNCAEQDALGFEMAIAYPPHSEWITASVKEYGTATVKGRWPTFGQNLRYVLDKRNAQLLDESGNYTSEGWMTVPDNTPVLATMNSSGRITHFGVPLPWREHHLFGCRWELEKHPQRRLLQRRDCAGSTVPCCVTGFAK